MSFGRKPYEKPPRAMPTRSSIAPSSPVRMADARSIASVPASEKPASRVQQKTPNRVQQAIRDAARDELCTVRLPGCPADPAMSIWSHNRHQRAGKGKGIKALDLNGCIACTYCDAIYDGQAPRPAGMTAEQVELAWYHGHAESLVLLRQKGLV
jgi:hypothetical protein